MHIPLFVAGTMGEAITGFVSALGSEVRVHVASPHERLPQLDLSLQIGGATLDSHLASGSEGWVAHLSTQRAQPIGEAPNPIGALASATLASSEIFKQIFRQKANVLGLDPRGLPDMRFLDGTISVSMLTYRTPSHERDFAPLPTEIEIGDLTVVGTGAGGGACLYALSLMNISGCINVVDPDVVNIHNLNRYVFAIRRHADLLLRKVSVIQDLFHSHQGVSLVPHPQPFDEFLRSHPEWNRDLVLSTVDTARIRHQIQWAVPRVILDAAVSSSTFYVHRVLLGYSACLRCTHEPEDKEADPLAAIADLLQVDARKLRNLYDANRPLAPHDLDTFGNAAALAGLPRPESGMTLRDWTQLHCSELDLGTTRDLVLPIPFATVLPGIMLAGEIVKERHYPDAVLRDVVNHNTASLPSNWLTTLYGPKPGCSICGDSTVKNVYANRYMP